MRIHLAPLHGVTNRVFRDAYFRHFGGFDSAMAPFILAARVSQAKPNHFKDLLPGPREAEAGPSVRIPLVPQILGNDPVAFAETARVLVDLGYSEVNLNLGCPYPMVANKRRGSGLLPFPDLVAKILDAAESVVGAKISVKLRLGRSDRSDIDRLMPVLNGYPLSRVIIHPRIGTQMYRGKADLDGFGRAAALCLHPVAYNGDIVDGESFAAVKSRFPELSEWMIGRGAIANPFLAEELRGTASVDDTARNARMTAFHADLYASYRAVLCGPAHALDKMKEIWSYLGLSFPGSKQALARVARAKTLADYESAVAEILG